jgi:hypothetical protein
VKHAFDTKDLGGEFKKIILRVLRTLRGEIFLAHEVGAQRCCFLPVQRWGEHKYSRLGLANPYEHIREFSAGELQIGKERYKGQEGFVFFEAA